MLEEGAQVMAQPGVRPPSRPFGHVTSSYHSAVLGRSIALALVAGGRARMGQTLYVPDRGRGRGRGHLACFLRPGGERACMRNSSLARRPPLLAMSHGVRALPPAARWILRGDLKVRAAAEQRSASSSRRWPAGPPRRVSQRRLWLGPDEWLLICPEHRADETAARAARCARGTCRTRSST